MHNKKFIVSLLTALLLLVGISYGSSVKADEVTYTNNSPQTTIFKSLKAQNTQLLDENKQTDTSNNQARFGFRWYCPEDDYTSAWHTGYSSAVSRADAHNLKYGHHAVVYGV